MWNWLFSPPKTSKERFEEIKREINKGIREIKREQTNMQRKKDKIKRDMRRAVEKGELSAAKMMAKNLNQCNNMYTKYYEMEAQLDATLMHIQSNKMTALMAQNMCTTARLVSRINRLCNLPQMKHVAMVLERETQIMGFKQELMTETMDDVMEGDDNEEVENEILAKVIEEVGLSTGNTLQNVKSNDNNNNKIDDELNERISNLTK